MTSQGRRSQGGRGGGCPPVFREICPFSPKKRGFQENFKILPPSFSKLKVLPPLFFGASYGPASLCFFFIYILHSVSASSAPTPIEILSSDTKEQKINQFLEQLKENKEDSKCNICYMHMLQSLNE